MDDTRSSGPVDVLAVIDAACCVLALDKHADPQCQLAEARAAVAELIEADRAYDTARSRYNAAFQNGPHGDIAEQRWAQEQLNDAKGRRSAALTNIRSAP